MIQLIDYIKELEEKEYLWTEDQKNAYLLACGLIKERANVLIRDVIPGCRTLTRRSFVECTGMLSTTFNNNISCDITKKNTLFFIEEMSKRTLKTFRFSCEGDKVSFDLKSEETKEEVQIYINQDTIISFYKDFENDIFETTSITKESDKGKDLTSIIEKTVEDLFYLIK